MMRPGIAIWPVRKQAEAMAASLAAALGGAVVGRGETAPAGDARASFRKQFHDFGAWIIIGTTGIAVRYIDGLLKDKHSDPAVVVVDEAGRFAVSLLCGHEGGANNLAFQVSAALGSMPVITTVTEALKPLVLGIGCRRGVGVEAVERAVVAALGDHPLEAVRLVSTIDLKKDEPGLLAFCARYSLPLQVIAAADLKARAWVTNPSAWVREVTGAEGVCEPCALIAAGRGSLLVPKTVLEGVTVAVVADHNWLSASPADTVVESKPIVEEVLP